MTVSELERQQATTRAIDQHAGAPGALLPVLHAIQDALGHVPDSALTTVAEALNLSLADVHGVVSFYHDFRRQPPLGPVVRLCRAEACQAMGSDALAAHLERRCAERSAASLSVEPAYCFGVCACAPSAMIDGVLHGRLDSVQLDRLLDAATAAR